MDVRPIYYWDTNFDYIGVGYWGVTGTWTRHRYAWRVQNCHCTRHIFWSWAFLRVNKGKHLKKIGACGANLPVSMAVAQDSPSKSRTSGDLKFGLWYTTNTYSLICSILKPGSVLYYGNTFQSQAVQQLFIYFIAFNLMVTRLFNRWHTDDTKLRSCSLKPASVGLKGMRWWETKQIRKASRSRNFSTCIKVKIPTCKNTCG